MKTLEVIGVLFVIAKLCSGKVNYVRILAICVFMFIFTACATSSQKASAYCDTNWKGRYDSWQACYDRQKDQHNSRAALFMKGFSQGYNQSRANNVSCRSVTTGAFTNTNCN